MRKLAEGEARTALIQTRVRPGAKTRFLQIAKALGKTESEAARDALADWVARNERR